MKVVAQRWYSYCEDEFESREWPKQSPRGSLQEGRQPHQPIVR